MFYSCLKNWSKLSNHVKNVLQLFLLNQIWYIYVTNALIFTDNTHRNSNLQWVYISLLLKKNYIILSDNNYFFLIIKWWKKSHCYNYDICTFTLQFEKYLTYQFEPFVVSSSLLLIELSVLKFSSTAYSGNYSYNRQSKYSYNL